MISRQTNAPPANEVQRDRLAFNSKEDTDRPFNQNLSTCYSDDGFCSSLPIAPAPKLPYAGSRRRFVGQAYEDSSKL